MLKGLIQQSQAQSSRERIHSRAGRLSLTPPSKATMKVPMTTTSRRGSNNNSKAVRKTQHQRQNAKENVSSRDSSLQHVGDSHHQHYSSSSEGSRCRNLNAKNDKQQLSPPAYRKTSPSIGNDENFYHTQWPSDDLYDPLHASIPSQRQPQTAHKNHCIVASNQVATSNLQYRHGQQSNGVDEENLQRPSQHLPRNKSRDRRQKQKRRRRKKKQANVTTGNDRPSNVPSSLKPYIATNPTVLPMTHSNGSRRHFQQEQQATQSRSLNIAPATEVQNTHPRNEPSLSSSSASFVPNEEDIRRRHRVHQLLDTPTRTKHRRQVVRSILAQEQPETTLQGQDHHGGVAHRQF